MFTQGDILLPTDFSRYAQYALRYAIALARKYAGRIHLVHVIDASLVAAGTARGSGLSMAELQTLLYAMRDQAENRLAHLVRIANDSGIEAEMHIAEGRPADEIVQLAKSLNCDLTVISTYGRTGLDRMVCGSCCEKVVRRSPVPVLCIKHPEHDFVTDPEGEICLRRILFPTDFSDFAARALPYAESLCREFNASLALVHVSEIPVVLPEFMPDATGAFSSSEETYARDMLEQCAASIPDIHVTTHVKIGLPYREIVEMAAQEAADLIVVPTHGHSGFAHLLFGGVAEKIVRLAQCPVLTIRPGGAPAEESLRPAIQSEEALDAVR